MAVKAATSRDAGKVQSESRPPTQGKGDVVMMNHNHTSRGFSFSAMLSPVALRLELCGLVALVLALGRIVPEFGKRLRQFSSLLFR
jgi:hypothetical protein